MLSTFYHAAMALGKTAGKQTGMQTDRQTDAIYMIISYIGYDNVSE
jgi:hypothetical protein